MNDVTTSAPGRFDLGLSEAEEGRAAHLHRQSIVFDMLSQHVGGAAIFDHYPDDLRAEFRAGMAKVGAGFAAAAYAMYWPYEMSLQGRSHLVRDWYFASGMTCGTYAVAVHDGRNPFAQRWDEMIARLRQLPWLRYVTRAAEIRQAKRDGVVALYGHCQPTMPAPRELAALDRAYGMGLRSFMLTYNRMDNIGVGCTERVDAGLSMYGVDVVKHCNDIGVIVDTSHCGRLTTLDACRYSRKPVNANHTCAKALSNVARAKTDEELKAIAETGGVIGVVTVPFFVTRQPPATIQHVLDHIDYIADLVGWRHVALGTDWPLQAPDDVHAAMAATELADLGFRPEDNVDVTRGVIGFRDYRDLPNITRGLVKRGYDDEQIAGILGENALRVFEEVCG